MIPLSPVSSREEMHCLSRLSHLTTPAAGLPTHSLRLHANEAASGWQPQAQHAMPSVVQTSRRAELRKSRKLQLDLDLPAHLRGRVDPSVS